MLADAYTTWRTTSLDRLPDVSVVVAVGADDPDRLAIESWAAHLALRKRSWELVALSLDGTPTAPVVEGLANGFSIGLDGSRDRLSPLRRGFEAASGQIVLLTGAESFSTLVELDRIFDRIADGADAVVGWPPLHEPVSSPRDLPVFMACHREVARSLSDARAVYGGSSFFDVMQIAHFWGVRVDEIQVSTRRAARAELVAPVRPAARVLATPARSMV